MHNLEIPISKIPDHFKMKGTDKREGKEKKKIAKVDIVFRRGENY
jgi:hypothetical protein